MAPHASEIRFAERYLAWLESNLPMLREDSRVRTIVEESGQAIARRCGLKPVDGYPLGTLDDGSRELLARLDDAGAEPMTTLTPEQAEIVLAGLPFTADEIGAHVETTIATWAERDGLPPEEVLRMLVGYGVVVGALVQGWRR